MRLLGLLASSSFLLFLTSEPPFSWTADPPSVTGCTRALNLQVASESYHNILPQYGSVGHFLPLEDYKSILDSRFHLSCPLVEPIFFFSPTISSSSIQDICLVRHISKILGKHLKCFSHMVPLALVTLIDPWIITWPDQNQRFLAWFFGRAKHYGV
ncbi:hypothetical protein C1H46_014130 [Malus baccata]|uniref:Uncharacterized protein n=1 Tax=Malus baccata TaxID=106549 RepID=A0A540MNC2_MALBA|nr:hypothetical protein C1H46_014130 [Malus baccata]